MTIYQKQAVLTVLSNLYYSFRKNPSLAFTLVNIPVYGVDIHNTNEYTSSLNELLALSAKYSDLIERNNSVNNLDSWQHFNQQLDMIFKRTIKQAFNNFVAFIPKLYNSIQSGNPDLVELSNELNTEVSFVIERGHPNILKSDLKHFTIYEGTDFTEHIKECYNFFICFESKYDLPNIYDKIDINVLQAIYVYLNNYGDIRK